MQRNYSKKTKKVVLICYGEEKKKIKSKTRYLTTNQKKPFLLS
ncbi:hypothetical protein SD78_1785 [Bacillus badius]|nr:hypothetical protein SD78_1785 [Bacillus badius]